MESAEDQIRRRAKRQAVEAMEDVAGRSETITYSQLAARITAQTYAPNGQAFSDLLGEVSRASNARRGVFLSAVVVHQQDDLPGDGFFELARNLDRSVGAHATFHQMALDEVHRAYANRPE